LETFHALWHQAIHNLFFLKFVKKRAKSLAQAAWQLFLQAVLLGKNSVPSPKHNNFGTRN
jgi:hypothetical protein